MIQKQYPKNPESKEIIGVVHNSPAWKAGIQSGDFLISVNNKTISDVLDYKYYTAEKRLVLELKSGKKIIKKDEYEDLGLEFATYLMNDKKHCVNNCIFCFINQLPKNMRETLYFKDDDSRLSFLQGNYITLTNLTDGDIERIIRMKLNVNVSVQTTNPELRCKMLSNPSAGKKLDYLYKMAEAGLDINCQLVLCPEINDGEELRKSLEKLTSLYPAVSSIACVPAGVTGYRVNLPVIKTYTENRALEVISIIEEFGDKMFKEHGDRLVYPADEFFLLAKKNIPEYNYYGDFRQYENGVGMESLFESEFKQALAYYDTEIYEKKSIATGVLAAPFITKLINLTSADIKIYPIKNDFFGETITVAGLVTGSDLIKQLLPHKDDLGKELLIPETMLKSDEDIFLDNITLIEAEKALGLKINKVGCSGEELLKSLFNGEPP